MDDSEESSVVLSHNTALGSKASGDKMFSLKKWNAVAMWSWDVECDTCAICRVQVMGESVRLVTGRLMLTRLSPRVSVGHLNSCGEPILHDAAYLTTFLHHQTLVFDARRKTSKRTVLVRGFQSIICSS